MGEGDKLNDGWGEFDSEIDVEAVCDRRSSFNLKYNSDGSAGEDIYHGHEESTLSDDVRGTHGGSASMRCMDGQRTTRPTFNTQLFQLLFDDLVL